MTYAETLTHIYALGRFGIKPGLERIEKLLRALGDPQDAFRALHVVGTNGKGSTASCLASILSAGGYRTGLFTSPHLISFTERIRVDGVEIAEEAVASLAERVLGAAPPGTTFFEIVTALAALFFAEAGVQLAVMEAGMGGRADATNAFSGLITALTPISLEHTDYLGEGIAQIAEEKAGICKPGAPIVCGRQQPEALAVIEAQAARIGAPLYRLGTEFDADWQDDTLSYRGISLDLEKVKVGLSGSYQKGNAALALAAAEVLAPAGFPLAPEALVAGLERVRWPGRMEFVAGLPRILLDGAHNPAGAAALAEALGEIVRGRLFLVLGVMGDKELSGMLDPLLPLCDRVYAVEPGIERALPAKELASACRRLGTRAIAAGSVARGLALAKEEAQPGDLVVVCGSLFTVGEARGVLLARNFEPFRG